MKDPQYSGKMLMRWSSMMTRCYDPSSELYANYGGRGIKVCERWHDFRNFHGDLGKIPKGLSMDRTDNDGDYSPENVRLTDARTQANNTRRNKAYAYQGRSQSIGAWAREIGIQPQTLKRRLDNGWTLEQALETPIRAKDTGETARIVERTGRPHTTILHRLKRGVAPDDLDAVHLTERTFEYLGRTHTLSEWAGLLGITRQALQRRIERGMSVEEAFSTPQKFFRKRPTLVEVDGEAVPLSQAAFAHRLHRTTLRRRLEAGMSPAEAIAIPPRQWERFEYQGRSQTVHSWAVELGVSSDTLRGRLKRGWTFAEAIETPVDSRRGRRVLIRPNGPAHQLGLPFDE